ncbi:MAG: hypothetical protein DRI57_28720 [Deltaproteobacteria bacterium]|nr:MAG: hypothetical protein DRI57_28720 [Deltaproteobacteria bacterium]
MNKQLIVGFAAEGPTDNRFLESVIQRSFEEAAFDCAGQVEILPVQCIKKREGDFAEVVKAYARDADKRGIMVLCIHVDADDATDVTAFERKINPAFSVVKELQDECLCKNLVAIVPVQMTEAWMLSDKELLKSEIGTNKSNEELRIDKPPESYNDPKQVITTAIAIYRQDMPKRRRKSLKIAELYSPIGQKVALNELEKLESYQKFKKAIRSAFRKLNYLN